MPKLGDSDGAGFATTGSQPETGATVGAAPSPSGRHRRSPRRFLSDEVHRAERRAAPVLHRRRWQQSRSQAPKTKGTIPAEEFVAQLQSDLRTEREKVLEPLLHRLQAMGKYLTEEHDVPPEIIEEGLVLWEMYLRRLHDLHIGQFHVAGPREDHPEPCALPLMEIENDPDRGAYRIRVIRAMESSYKFHVSGYRELLGIVLTDEAQAELAWEGYEEDYAKTCLPTHLSQAAVDAWATVLEQSRNGTTVLRDKVREYLERTAAFATASA